jgi:glycogen debranching enzyme
MAKHLFVILICGIWAVAQTPAGSAQDVLSPIPRFPFQGTGPISIVREAVPSRPFSVVGPRGAMLGWQDGTFEAWIFPWKIFSNMRITAEMKDYPVPIDLNKYAAGIEVQPDHTTITFSHANFTVREILFAPQQPHDGAGVLAFYQIEAVRPMTLTFHFTPEMKLMWPAPSDDYPSPEWVNLQGGFYVLHLNFPDHAAAIAMPQATRGTLAPYQERPQTYPLEFVLNFDPTSDSDKIFPLLLVTADTKTASTTAALEEKLHAMESSFVSLFHDNQNYYQNFLREHLSIKTPDEEFNQAFLWAELAIEQLRVQTLTHQETALVAGFYSSGESARPGFGWYFGRDALWTLYAVNSYGDFQLARDELEFLIHRQRADGKIMHEWSQTADLIDWKSLPYEFASADATPLLIMAMSDYLKVSGDQAFVRSHWDAVQKAWNFERSHDSDGDGIYENTEGSGWVESWPPGMPLQEIYLAALDQQASSAFANLARAAGHPQMALEAGQRASHIKQQIEKEYFVPKEHFYAFSWNGNGTTDPSATIYPAVADWDGALRLQQPGPMLSRWASDEFSTDWGTRDLSPKASFYDPISYHQGTVWPLFTGWVSLSEYRNGRSLSGYAHLMQNADLTWSQDLGAVTELLSGEFFQPLGRSTSHQLWSSAMVVSPAIRGLFGLEWNAERNTIRVTPSLPADWNEAELHHVPLGNTFVDLAMRRVGTTLEVSPTGPGAATLHLESGAPGSKMAAGVLRIPLAKVEVGIPHGLPEPGSTTRQLKVLDQRASERSLMLRLAAPANSQQTLFLRINDIKANVRSNDLDIPASHEALRRIQISFPQGTGYVEKVVTLGW